MLQLLKATVSQLIYRFALTSLLTTSSAYHWPGFPGSKLFSSDGLSLLQRQLYEVRNSTSAPFEHKPLTEYQCKADLVQDMYLKELKFYKLPLVKPSDSEGHVQKFSPPKAPKSPEESDIANDLKAYENQQVDVEGQASGAEATATEEDCTYSSDCFFIVWTCFLSHERYSGSFTR